ncbi:MAG: hypothetical protein Fur005_44310 [Roseiflexaceae bacterium]
MRERLQTLLTWRRLLMLLILGLVGIALLMILRATGAALSPAGVREALASLGPWGPLALIIALAALLVIPIVPATILQIAAGLAFGPPLGLVYVLIADLLGATIGFWLARRGRSLIEQRISDETRATLEKLSRRVTWRSMLLLRLLPGPAYPIVSFAAGYSPISFTAYTLSSLLGVLPSLALLVLAGDLVTSSPLLAFGVVLLLAVALAVAGRYLSKGK